MSKKMTQQELDKVQSCYDWLDSITAENIEDGLQVINTFLECINDPNLILRLEQENQALRTSLKDRSFDN